MDAGPARWRPLPLSLAALLLFAALQASALARPDRGGSPVEAAGRAIRLAATTPEAGWLGVRVRAPGARAVTLSEQAGTQLERIATLRVAHSRARRRHLLRWRCDRRVRRLVATAVVNGSERRAAVRTRTPSCRRRLRAYARPLRPRAGGRVAIRVLDSWGTGGIDGRACLRPPGGEQRCRRFQIAVGRARALPGFGVERAGRWSLGLTTPWRQRLRRPVQVRAAGERLRVLATGDSMVQYVDTALAKRLEPEVEVRSDARVSTGISKPALLDWVRHARSQVARYRPDVTVVFLGANDGFPLRSGAGRRVRCCGRAWIRAYAARARRMMASYARRGRGQVYWLTLPAPRPRQWKRIYAAVNAALRRASARFGDELRLIDLGRVFTPHGRFRATMRWRGHAVGVRQGDGVHLTPAGAAIAAGLVTRKLRRGHVLE